MTHLLRAYLREKENSILFFFLVLTLVFLFLIDTSFAQTSENSATSSTQSPSSAESTSPSPEASPSAPVIPPVRIEETSSSSSPSETSPSTPSNTTDPSSSNSIENRSTDSLSPQTTVPDKTPQAESTQPTESSDQVLDSVQSLIKEAEEASPSKKNKQKHSDSSSSQMETNLEIEKEEQENSKQLPQNKQKKTIKNNSNAGAQKKLTLQECLERALENNPRILQAKQALERAKGVVITAKSTLYPTINLNGRLFKENEDLWGQNNDSNDSRGGFNDNWVTTLAVQHSIYSGGINRHNIAIAKLQNEIEYLKLHQTINDTLFEITRAFYSVLVNQSDVKTRKENVQLLTEEVQRQKNLFEAGRATKFQILRTEVRLSNEMPGLIDAQNKVRTSTMQLVELMGASSLDTLVPEAIHVKGDLNCPYMGENLQSLIEKAIVRSPSLSEQIKRKEISRRQMLIAKASNLPRLNLFAGVSAEHDGNDSDKSSFWDADVQAAAGIQGIWNIFDGFEGKGRAMQALAQMEIDEIAAKEAIRSIDFSVRRAYLDLKQAEASVKTQQGNVKKAEESMQLSISSVEAGFGTQFDVLQASVDLTTARNVELQARAQYHLALATLDKLLYNRVRAELADEKETRKEIQSIRSNASTFPSNPPTSQTLPSSP